MASLTFYIFILLLTPTPPPPEKALRDKKKLISLTHPQLSYCAHGGFPGFWWYEMEKKSYSVYAVSREFWSSTALPKPGNKQEREKIEKMK